METIEVHNIYTLYELEEDGTASNTPILSFSRPQDWGDSTRWHYHDCRLQFSYSGTVYINNCHVWQEVDISSIEAFPRIAEQLFMVMMPGSKEQLAGREFLDEDDFWLPEWGKQPLYYERDEENYDY